MLRKNSPITYSHSKYATHSLLPIHTYSYIPCLTYLQIHNKSIHPSTPADSNPRHYSTYYHIAQLFYIPHKSCGRIFFAPRNVNSYLLLYSQDTGSCNSEKHRMLLLSYTSMLLTLSLSVVLFSNIFSK